MSKQGKRPRPAPEHTCCWHVAGGQFGILREGERQPSAVGNLSICCHCGTGMVRYIGGLELGHGPHVEYGRPASLLLVPGDGRPS